MTLTKQSEQHDKRRRDEGTNRMAQGERETISQPLLAQYFGTMAGGLRNKNPGRARRNENADGEEEECET